MSDLTNAGATAAAAALASSTLGSGCYIGVGDSVTPFVATQTDLIAGTNKQRNQVASSTLVGNVLSLASTFVGADANFAWNECGVFSDAIGGVMHLRKVINLPTKTSAETWTLQLDIAYTAG